MVFAVAAGNSGTDAQGFVPAAYDDTVITASATQQAGDLKQDWPAWSNWGDGYTNSSASLQAAPVGLAAPGVNVLSTCYTGGTCTMSGTSMASPHLAGTVALFLQGGGQSAAYSAFANTRAALLGEAESTDNAGSFVNGSGHPHDESFLNARPF